MKKTNRQLMVGSLQPLLFCLGMYFVVLIFSILVCSSVYKSIKSERKSLVIEKKAEPSSAVNSQMMASLGK